MANITQIDLGVITPIPKGDYSLTTNYERLNLVVYKGSSWIRTDIEPYVIGSIPQTGSLYWQLNASGVSEIPDASLTVKGITKLSNATNSVDETVAATSRAVKSAYDIGSTAVSSATTANNTANSVLSIANSTKAITDLVSLTAIAGGIPKADSTGKLALGWIDIPAGKAIGEVFIYTGIDVPAGALPADGTQYTGFNVTYPDAYTWVTTKAKTKTLTEYTAIVNQHGECGFWGLDTATGTVRVPMIKSFIQGTTSVDDISKSVEAGLPNITGTLASVENRYDAPSYSGALSFYRDGNGNLNIGGSGGNSGPLSFDASISNAAYGKSTTVQPPSIKYRWFVQIYSSVLPASTADMANWNTQLDGRANTTLSNLTQEGTTKVAHLAMPSARVINLQADDAAAVADGYLYICAWYLAGTSWIRATVDGRIFQTSFSIPSNTDYISLFIPIRKSQLYSLRNFRCTWKLIEFVYAEGAY